VVIELRVPKRDPQAFALALSGYAALKFPIELVARDNGDWLEVTVPNRRDKLDAALGVLQSVSELQLARAARAGVRIPFLYESGIQYEREPRGREWWQTAADNLYQLSGDCEDLANHRAAELVVFAGEPARAICVRTGPRVFHAVVLRGDGTIEDPSAALGMMKRRDPWPS
jgi:hypothetical protein